MVSLLNEIQNDQAAASTTKKSRIDEFNKALVSLGGQRTFASLRAVELAFKAEKVCCNAVCFQSEEYDCLLCLKFVSASEDGLKKLLWIDKAVQSILDVTDSPRPKNRTVALEVRASPRGVAFTGTDACSLGGNYLLGDEEVWAICAYSISASLRPCSCSPFYNLPFVTDLLQNSLTRNISPRTRIPELYLRWQSSSWIARRSCSLLVPRRFCRACARLRTDTERWSRLSTIRESSSASSSAASSSCRTSGTPPRSTSTSWCVSASCIPRPVSHNAERIQCENDMSFFP